MFEESLKKYAELCIKMGVNLQKNQPLVISAPIECKDFVRLLTECAYDNGCSYVHTQFYDNYLSLLRYEKAPEDSFSKIPNWAFKSIFSFVKDEGAAILNIGANDPDLLKNVDPKKISEASKASSIAGKEYFDYMVLGNAQWCVVSVPTAAWAKKVFPNIKEKDAIEKLWDAIFKSVRVDKDDPIKEWEIHNDNLAKRSEYLTNKNFKFLKYKSSTADLTIELPKNNVWIGGAAKSSNELYFDANMPTEEIFTLPVKTGVNGYVKNTKPLISRGKMLDNFTLHFKDGKIIDFEAETGYDILKGLIETDEGSSYLGEVALVPINSPISTSNILFYNALFDENASCHLAIGNAYPSCIKDGEKMTQEELKKVGVNSSIIHVDFMIGSKDLNIFGETFDGETIQIFKDGNWAF